MQNNTVQNRMPTVGGDRGLGGPNRFNPGAKPKNAAGTLRRVAGLYAKWGKPIFAATGLTAVSAAITVFIPYFVGECVNTFDVDSFTVDYDLLLKNILIIAALNVSNWLISTVNGVITLKTSQKIVFMLRSALFAKMQKLPLSYYDTHSHGDTMSRVTNDVDNISTTIAQSTTQLISSVLTIFGSILIMLFLNVPLTLTVLVAIPLVAVLTKTAATKSRAYFLAQQRSLGDLNGIIEENIVGLKTVKAFVQQNEALECFRQINENLYDSSRKAQIYAGFMMPLMNVINNLVFALVSVTGGYLCVSSGLAIGTVVSFLSYSKQFSMPLNAIAGMFNTIQSALAGAERVFEILDEGEEAPDEPDAVLMETSHGNVRFENVRFSYDKNKEIIKDVSFDIKGGQSIALVGETGSGKTTIINLLTRFYDTDSGNILIDGVNIRHIKRGDLRNLFSVVLQDTCLFTGTVMDNIRYSKPDAPDADVINAAKLTRADDFISKLPNGYMSEVSGSHDNLSEGQRQLIAISRAVLCGNPILILDEATSSVDTKTEKDIQRALLNLMKNRTSFLIAHRLSTIRDADMIIVVENGRIAEIGSHDELIRKNGLYCRMVMSQMGQTPSNTISY